MKLFAKFEIRIIAPLLIAAPITEKNHVGWQYSKNEFHIDISLPLETDATTIRQDDVGIHEIFKIRLTISRNEKDLPPASDRKGRSVFFQSICDDYLKVAEETVNTLLCFFRYRLANPLVKTIYFYDDNNLCNPKWLDENGNEINPDFGISTGSCMPARYYDHEFDIRSYEHQKNQQELQKWLNSPEGSELYTTGVKPADF